MEREKRRKFEIKKKKKKVKTDKGVVEEYKK
jgi:hypothetical protein